MKGLAPVTRKWERTQVEIPVTLLLDGGSAAFSAMSVDVSPRGMRLQSDATFLKGEPVRIQITPTREHFLNARVAWVGDAKSPSAGHAGLEFLNSHNMFVH